MRGILLSLLTFSLACRSDKGVTKFNSPPDANITSHADGVTLLEGYAVTFEGVASDANHFTAELEAKWQIGSETICDYAPVDEDGISRCEHVVTLTDADVTLVVKDPEDATGDNTISIVVEPTETPQAEILQPTGDGIYYSDQLITFQGVLSDSEDAAADLTGFWRSSLDGDLTEVAVEPNADGAVTGYAFLPTEGQHAIELHVEDSTGKTAMTSTVITVGPPNTAPDCSITAPATGSAGAEGVLVTFEGLASDVDVPSSLLTVSWQSNQDGELGASVVNSDGEVSLPISDLSVNTHVISLTVRDEVGGECIADMIYTVGTPPSALIDSPLDGAVYNEGDLISFSATLSDAQNLPDQLALAWTLADGTVLNSDPATTLGTAQFALDNLPTGAQALTLTATDTDGLTADDMVTFEINGLPTIPTVSIGPDPAFTDSVVMANGSDSVDAEGSVTYEYMWVHGSTTVSGATLSPADTAKHQNWTVSVTPFDDTAQPGPTATASIVISNSSPVLSAALISPGSARHGETLSCSATATDADNDALSYTYEWSNGVDVIGSTDTYLIDAAETTVGGTVSCTVTATDGDGGSDVATATAGIDNTDPVINNVSVTPSVGVSTSSTLSCVVSALDAEDGFPQLSLEWTNVATGAVLGTGGTLALNPVDSSPGDEIRCDVVATDSNGGTDSEFDSVTVENTPPTAPEISVQGGECGSLYFSGNDYARAASTSDFDSADEYTIEAWVNWGGSSGEPHYPIFNQTWNGLHRSFFNIRSTGALFFEAQLGVPGNTQNVIASGGSVTPGQWTHVAVVYSLTEIRLYIDGSEVAASASAGSIPTSDGILYIGEVNTGYQFLGHIDDLRYSAGERYTGNFQPPSQMLNDADTLGLWLMNDGSGTTATDNSGNGLDAAITGASWSTDCANAASDWQCIVDLESTDADNDTVSYIYDWLDPNGVLQQSTGPTTDLEDTLSLGNLMEGDWTCEVTPTDGVDEGIFAVETFSVTAPCDTSMLGIDALDITGGNTYCDGMTNDMAFTLNKLTDGDVGDLSGNETGNLPYNACFFYDFFGSRTLTLDVAPGSTVSGLRYFSSNNHAGSGVLPPVNFSVRLLPADVVVVPSQTLSSAWNDFTFAEATGVEQVEITFDKQSEHSCVSEIELILDCDTTDADGDGYLAWEDCDDSDPAVYMECDCPDVISFNGGGDGVALPGVNAMTGDQTMEAWVKLDAPPASLTLLMSSECGSVYITPTEIYAETIDGCLGAAGNFCKLGHNNSTVWMNNNNPGAGDGGFLFSDWDGSWRHLAVTVDTSQVATLFVDGVSFGSAQMIADGCISGLSEGWIGNGYNPWSIGMEGEMAALRLSSDLVYSSDFSPSYPLSVEPSTEVLFNMTNSAGSNTLVDESGNGHDGTILSATWLEGTPDCEDIDGDGYVALDDCDDADPAVFDSCVYTSCFDILMSGQASGDGVYTIDPDGNGSIDVYCDMTTDGGGWTLIGQGGSQCSNSISESISMTDGDSCGYLSWSRVGALAHISSEVELRVGPNLLNAASSSKSTNGLAIEALHTETGTWHNGATWDNWNWNWGSGCSHDMTGWPNMFHACAVSDGPHWYSEEYGGGSHSQRAFCHMSTCQYPVSSNWLR